MEDDVEKIFSLSNVAPQDPQLKKGYWKRLNQRILDLTKENRVVVISGPLYLEEKTSNGKQYVNYQVIGKNRVGAPSHFFKVVYTSEGDKPEIYIIPNKDVEEKTPLKSSQVRAEKFEKMSGIILPETVIPYLRPPIRPVAELTL